MKTALAIVCSLLLVWTQVVQAYAPGVGGAGAARACCHCGDASCCAAKSIPESQPVSATPVSSGLQGAWMMFSSAALSWTLPAAPAAEFSTSFVSPFAAESAPLYTRNCVFLI